MSIYKYGEYAFCFTDTSYIDQKRTVSLNIAFDSLLRKKMDAEKTKYDLDSLYSHTQRIGHYWQRLNEREEQLHEDAHSIQ